jgi:hypothetical protein
MSLAVAANPDDTDKPWPSIDRSWIEGFRPEPAPFPLQVLPERWRAWVEAAAEPGSCVDYTALSLLGAVSSVLGGGAVVKVTPHWTEPMLTWQALVGGPASGKSVALAAGRRLIEAIRPPEADREPDDAPRAEAKGEANEDEPDEAREEQRSPGPAVLPDATIDTAKWALHGSPRGVALWRDDLADWLIEARREGWRAAWRAGWQARDVLLHRGRGRFEAEAFAVGVTGALRAERLPEVLDEDAHSLAPCFLYAWPGLARWRGHGSATAEEDAVKMLRRIDKLAASAAYPGVLGFDPDAQVAFEELLPKFGVHVRDADGIEAEWIAHGPSMVARLCGQLSILRWAAESDAALPDDIAMRDVKFADDLWARYLLPQARTVFGSTSPAQDRLCRRVVRWLRRTRFEEVSREDIRRDALGQTLDAEGTDRVIERLERGNVLRARSTAPANKQGGRPRLRWEVNPQILQ